LITPEPFFSHNAGIGLLRRSGMVANREAEVDIAAQVYSAAPPG
jgi:hypothetical protein